MKKTSPGPENTLRAGDFFRPDSSSLSFPSPLSEAIEAETPLAYKDATKVKAQIARFGLAQVVGDIQPLGCIMAGELPEPAWQRVRREKRAAHKASRREGADEVLGG
jgi:hypothetical protein